MLININSLCMFVWLYPINFKTVEPIGQTFFKTTNKPPGKVLSIKVYKVYILNFKKILMKDTNFSLKIIGWKWFFFIFNKAFILSRTQMKIYTGWVKKSVICGAWFKVVPFFVQLSCIWCFFNIFWKCVTYFGTHYSNIRSFRFFKFLKKSNHFMFFLGQILVNSHWELNLMCTSKKNKCHSKFWLGL